MSFAPSLPAVGAAMAVAMLVAVVMLVTGPPPVARAAVVAAPGLPSNGSTSTPAGGARPAPTGVSPAVGCGIDTTPTGPPRPAGGWTTVMADDFNAPLGTGRGDDDLWYPNQPGVPVDGLGGANNASFELERYDSSQVSVSEGNLDLTAQPTADGYVSGMAATSGGDGYEPWTWTPGAGQTMAFEMVAAFPTADGRFNAFWSTSVNGWTNEMDFLEAHPGNVIDSDHIYRTNPKEQQFKIGTLPFDPSAGFHRYTYVVNANQSWAFYVDGVLQTWAGGPYEPSSLGPMDILLNYAVTGDTGLALSTFSIDSVAVYEDTPHAGRDISGIAIAPGTKVACTVRTRPASGSSARGATTVAAVAGEPGPSYRSGATGPAGGSGRVLNRRPRSVGSATVRHPGRGGGDTELRFRL